MELKLLIYAAGIVTGAAVALGFALRDIKRIRKEYSQLLTQYKQLLKHQRKEEE